MLETKRIAHLSFVFVGAALLAACPGPGNSGGGGNGIGDGIGTGDPVPATKDVTIDNLATIEVGGALMSPMAMGMPAMARVVPKKPVTLDKQRKAFAAAKPAAKAAQGRVLATLLWDTAKDAEDDAKQALWQEAITVLEEVRTAAGDQIDEITLQMLFTFHRWMHDDAAALAAAAEVLEKFPESKSADALAPWVGFLQLSLWRNDDAAALVQAWPAEKLAADPQRAYIAAWSAFRSGDADTARGLILDATAAWSSERTLPTLQVEAVNILVRTGTGVDEASAAIRQLSGGQPAVEYLLAYRLYEAYVGVGRAGEAWAALDIAIGLGAPAGERMVLLVQQANLALVEGKLQQIAAKMGDALAAAAECAEACAGQDAAILEQVVKLGSHLHTVYATTQDEAYYTGAKALYELAVGSGYADAATVQGYQQNLEETKTNMAAGAGMHDAKIVEDVIALHTNTAKGCYEAQLQAEPSLAGTIGLELVIGNDGRVAEMGGDFPDNSPGLQAAVDCLTERAQQWVFPARTAAGKTTVKVSYAVAPGAVQ